MYDNRVVYVKGLLPLTALRSLDLSGNRIEHIEGVSHLKQLSTLRLSNNRITELGGLEKLPSLEILDVSYNRVQRMERLQGCTGLKELALNGNQITAIEGLGRCSLLAELALSGNRLTSLKGLKEVASSLDILWVNDNLLESLRGIPESLPKLTELNIAGNKLTSLQPLERCCPALELLDVSRNKLASIRRLAAALSPLEELAEVKADSNPFCHQPEGQAPYRERAIQALPRLQYLDDLEITDGERESADRLGCESRVGSCDGLRQPPGPAVKTVPGIREGGDAGEPPGSRPSSTGSETPSGQRPLSSVGSRPRAAAGGSRPGTPSFRQLEGAGPLGRPSTPRTPGRPATPAQGSGTPLMMQRPPSARRGGAASLPTAEQYEASLLQFTATMEEYQVQMQDVVRQLRASLAQGLPEATAAIRADGMRGPEGSVTAALPQPPQLPTFEAHSDAESAMKRVARAEGAGQIDRGRNPAGAAAAGSRPASVTGLVEAIPDKADKLMGEFSRLFPAEELPVACPPHRRSGRQHSEGEPAPAPPPSWPQANRMDGYPAPSGFTRLNMDDLEEDEPSLTGAEEPNGARLSQGGSAPEQRALAGSETGKKQSVGGQSSSDLLSRLDALQQMVLEYSEPEVPPEGTAALGAASAACEEPPGHGGSHALEERLDGGAKEGSDSPSSSAVGAAYTRFRLPGEGSRQLKGPSHVSQCLGMASGRPLSGGRMPSAIAGRGEGGADTQVPAKLKKRAAGGVLCRVD
uniref:Leucine-rich protein n=1 Tax=Tetraselmis sp. GSL018 TaxID=582737 RepID=A0A061RTZ2_9CHLO